MRRPAQYAMGLLVSCLLFSSALHSQSSPGPLLPPVSSSPASPTYENTTEGLRLLLESAVRAARNGDNEKLTQLVKEMEIPDYENWFAKMYGTEKGNSWSGPYGAGLAENERSLREQLERLGQQPGQVATRKVNDAPEPASDLERGMIASLKQPVNIFFADWRPPDAFPDTKGLAIGYFLFLDGRFRWDSRAHVIGSINFSRNLGTQIDVPDSSGRGGRIDFPISSPKCIYCPAPEYPAEARYEGIEGTVTLRVTIGTDGHAANIELVQGVGHGLDERAVDVVQMWRFDPARRPNGDPVPVRTAVEVSFRLQRQR